MIRRSRHGTTKTPAELSYSRRLNDFQGWIEPMADYPAPGTA
jgi:hypothetical protein